MGYVLQRALTYMGFTRIAIFSTVDYYSSQSLEKLLSEDVSVNSKFASPKFEVLFSAILQPGADFTDYIKAAKASSALVFVLLTDPETTAQLLVKGKQAGLFPVGSTILGHDLILVSQTIDAVAALDPTQSPDYYFKGFMGFRPQPNFALTETAAGRAFVDHFLARAKTMHGATASACSTAVDGYGNVMFLKNGQCAGLEMATLTANRKVLAPYVGNVYDAVIALAFALDNILVGQGVSMADFGTSRAPDGPLLMKAFTGSVTFTGATDDVSFSEGLKIRGKRSPAKIGYGDRDTGFTFTPVNYIAADVADNYWAEVGRWDVHGDWQLCDERLMAELSGPLVPCEYQVVYNTADGKRGKDRHPDIIERVPIGLNFFFIALGVVGLVLLLLLSLFFIYHRNAGIVKSSQPPMMAMVLCGEGLVCLRVIFAALVDLDRPGAVWLCMTHKWFGHLGPCMVFGGLFLKVDGAAFCRPVLSSHKHIPFLAHSFHTSLSLPLGIDVARGQNYQHDFAEAGQDHQQRHLRHGLRRHGAHMHILGRPYERGQNICGHWHQDHRKH